MEQIGHRGSYKFGIRPPVTIVTSTSPKDIMAQPGPKSIDKIVQRIQLSNKDGNKDSTYTEPNRAQQSIAHVTNFIQLYTIAVENLAPAGKPIRHEPNKEQNQDSTAITIPDSQTDAKTAILIESEDELPMIPEDAIHAPSNLSITAESKRIFTMYSSSPLIQHARSDDEDNLHKDEAANVSSTSPYSTIPSEILRQAAQNAGPITSLDTEDIE